MKRWRVQILMIVVAAFAPVVSALAVFYNSGTYGTCQYNSCSISIASSGSVDLAVDPTGSGSCTSQYDDVTIDTDDSNGFTLLMSDLTANTNLVKGAANIPSTTGTFASPIPLVVNTWGYRIDGLGGFGPGFTLPVTDVPLNGTTYAAVKPYATPETLAVTSSPAVPTVHAPMLYSVCANNVLAPGRYTTTVIYTAITND